MESEQKEAVIEKMLLNGFTIDDVVAVSGMSEQEIEKILEDLENREAKLTKGILIFFITSVIGSVGLAILVSFSELLQHVMGIICEVSLLLLFVFLYSVSITFIARSVGRLFGKEINVFKKAYLLQLLYVLVFWLAVPLQAKELMLKYVQFSVWESTGFALGDDLWAGFPFQVLQTDVLWYVLVPQIVVLLLSVVPIPRLSKIRHTSA